MSTPEQTVPKACPHCGATPLTKREPEWPSMSDTPHKWYVACANEMDCPEWPMTHLQATPEEAVAAWNRGETH